MPRKIEISYKTITFVGLFVVFSYLLYFIRDIILQFFVALLIMAILNPLVTRIAKYRIARSLSIFLVYVLIAGIVTFAVAGIGPAMATQTSEFVVAFPKYLQNLGVPGDIADQVFLRVLSQAIDLSGQLAKFAISIFSNVLSVFTVFIVAYYLLLAREKVDTNLSYFIGEERGRFVARLIDVLEEDLGGWARGQLILMSLVGILTYVGLEILGMPFALPLALLAGILEIVPYVGPLVSAVPLAIIGFGISPVMGFAVVALTFLVQQLENYFFVPKIMEKSIGVNPVITLLALSIGFRLAGVAGIIISVPVVIAMRVLLRQYYLDK